VETEVGQQQEHLVVDFEEVLVLAALHYFLGQKHLDDFVQHRPGDLVHVVRVLGNNLDDLRELGVEILPGEHVFQDERLDAVGVLDFQDAFEHVRPVRPRGVHLANHLHEVVDPRAVPLPRPEFFLEQLVETVQQLELLLNLVLLELSVLEHLAALLLH